ncbi:MAG: TetR/AcrR family transcriptional regulator [Pseudomonadota bacterium]
MKTNEPSKAEQTRQFIIEKAAPVFNKKGIAGTSLADITRATGLTKGSIYGNFKDKDAVAVAVFEYNLDNLTTYLSREMDRGETAVDKLLAFAGAYRKLYRKMIDYGGCPILNTATEADDTHRQLCRLTSDAINAMRKTVETLVEQGKASGEIHARVNAAKIATIAISLIEGGSVLTKATGEDQYMLHCLEHLELLVRSIAVKNG